MAKREDEITTTFDIPNKSEVSKLPVESKLKLIQQRMYQAMMNRLQRLRSEAASISVDMEVVNHRLLRDGPKASIDSVHVAGFHIAQTEMRVLVKSYLMISGIIAGEDATLELGGEESDE